MPWPFSSTKSLNSNNKSINATSANIVTSSSQPEHFDFDTDHSYPTTNRMSKPLVKPQPFTRLIQPTNSFSAANVKAERQRERKARKEEEERESIEHHTLTFEEEDDEDIANHMTVQVAPVNLTKPIIKPPSPAPAPAHSSQKSFSNNSLKPKSLFSSSNNKSSIPKSLPVKSLTAESDLRLRKSSSGSSHSNDYDSIQDAYVTGLSSPVDTIPHYQENDEDDPEHNNYPTEVDHGDEIDGKLSSSSPSPSYIMEMLYFYLPITNWLPLYSLRRDLIGDLIAGLTVALMVVPQGLAYATIAEIPPQYGLYTALAGCLFYVPFGTSRDLNVGPTAVLSLLTVSCLPDDLPLSDRISQSITLGFFAGVFQIFLGLLRAGQCLDFISLPVISGFVSATAITIAFTQLKHLTGISPMRDQFTYAIYDFILNIHTIKLYDTVLGISCIGVLLLLSQYKMYTREKNPVLWLTCIGRNALVVIGATLFSYSLIDSNYTKIFSTVSDVPSGLPYPDLSFFSSINGSTTNNLSISSLLTSSFIIAVIGILETIAVGKGFAKRNNYMEKLRPSQELISTGMCQMLGALCFNAYSNGGSFSRTAVNSAAGVRSNLGSFIAALFLVISLLFFCPLFKYIPQSALAAVIISAVLTMVDFSLFIQLYRLGKYGITFDSNPDLNKQKKSSSSDDYYDHNDTIDQSTHSRDLSGGVYGTIVLTPIQQAGEFILVVLLGLLYIPYLLVFKLKYSLTPQGWLDLACITCSFYGCLLLSIEWGIVLSVLLNIGIVLFYASKPNLIVLTPHLSHSDNTLLWLESSSKYLPVSSTNSADALLYLEEVRRCSLCVRIEGELLYFSIGAIVKSINQIERDDYIDQWEIEVMKENKMRNSKNSIKSKHKVKKSLLTITDMDNNNLTDEERKFREEYAIEHALAVEEEETTDNQQDNYTEKKGKKITSENEEDYFDDTNPDSNNYNTSSVVTEVDIINLSHLRALLLDFSCVNSIDSSGVTGISSLLSELINRNKRVCVHFINCKWPIRQLLMKYLMLHKIYNSNNNPMNIPLRNYFHDNMQLAILTVQRELGILPINAPRGATANAMATAGGLITNSTNSSPMKSSMTPIKNAPRLFAANNNSSNTNNSSVVSSFNHTPSPGMMSPLAAALNAQSNQLILPTSATGSGLSGPASLIIPPTPSPSYSNITMEYTQTSIPTSENSSNYSNNSHINISSPSNQSAQFSPASLTLDTNQVDINKKPIIPVRNVKPRRSTNTLLSPNNNNPNLGNTSSTTSSNLAANTELGGAGSIGLNRDTINNNNNNALSTGHNVNTSTVSPVTGIERRKDQGKK